MTEQELNKKLAEHYKIIEKRRVINTGREDEEYEDEAYFLVETGERITFNLVQVGFYSGYPPLTQSLDACFKWLVPKLKDIYSLFLEYDAMCDDFKCYLGEVDDEGEAIIGETEYGLCLLALPICAIDATPALALCKAIEKLIDGEKGELNGRERT